MTKYQAGERNQHL